MTFRRPALRKATKGRFRAATMIAGRKKDGDALRKEATAWNRPKRRNTFARKKD